MHTHTVSKDEPAITESVCLVDLRQSVSEDAACVTNLIHSVNSGVLVYFSCSSSCSNETIYQQTKLNFTDVWQEKFHPPTKQPRGEMRVIKSPQLPPMFI